MEGSRTRLEDQLFDLCLTASLNPNSKKFSKMKVLEDEVRRHERRSVVL